MAEIRFLSRTDPQDDSYHARLRRSALRLVHGSGGPVCCAECGEEDTDVLELHHTDHDGYRWRPIHGVGTQFYRYLLLRADAPKPSLAVLCASCHAKITKNPKKLQSNLSPLHAETPPLAVGHPPSPTDSP